jgi:hypothetical protein
MPVPATFERQGPRVRRLDRVEHGQGTVLRHRALNAQRQRNGAARREGTT